MPVRFRDLTAGDEAGYAGFLKFEQEAGGGMRGALFIIDGRGEPHEFTFTRVDIGVRLLWRASDAHRRAVAALAKALFGATAESPELLIALAQEAPPDVFIEDIATSVPLILLTETADNAPAPGDVSEALGELLRGRWAAPPPATGAPARRLLETLAQRGLLLEPFARAHAGLVEAFAREST